MTFNNLCSFPLIVKFLERNAKRALLAVVQRVCRDKSHWCGCQSWIFNHGFANIWLCIFFRTNDITKYVEIKWFTYFYSIMSSSTWQPQLATVINILAYVQLDSAWWDRFARQGRVSAPPVGRTQVGRCRTATLPATPAAEGTVT